MHEYIVMFQIPISYLIYGIACYLILLGISKVVTTITIKKHFSAMNKRINRGF